MKAVVHQGPGKRSRGRDPISGLREAGVIVPNSSEKGGEVLPDTSAMTPNDTRARRGSGFQAGAARFLLALLALLPAPLAVATSVTEDAESPGGEVRQVAIAPKYKAGGFHCWLWGTDYRPLWTTPIRVEVLNLQTFAGGLKPLFRVGGVETKGLAMKGADGRDYTFRGIDKDPTSILPADLQDTWAKSIVQDQIAANHPASFFVVDELMKASGILRTEQLILVMPDDPALGEFRKDFAGLVGQVFEYPGAKSDKNPGFQGATEILKHDVFYKRIETDSKDRPDTRALLKARLLDIMIGDFDRHRDQWRWAKFPEKELWQPIPDDRDQAFCRYEGLVLALARPRIPILQNYSDHYPGMEGLTWNGRDQDRQLLAGLERPVYKEVAQELKAQITDEVIDRAAHRMPPEYFKIDGTRLIHDLKGRRDRLVEGAEAFYEYIADKVKVYLTDAPEYVEVKRLDNGDTLVQAWRQGEDGKPAGEPFFHRTLHKGETQEVQIYLMGGNDRVVTLGKPNSITVRVIGGHGHAVVDDTKGGGTRLSDTGSGELLPGPGSHLDRQPYTPPPPPKSAPWIPPRDWGRNTLFVPWLSYGSDLGALIGGGIDTQAFGFRKEPYASRHIIRVAWATAESTFRADYKAEFHFENRGVYVGWYAYASGVEASHFFGFGNETPDGGNQNSDFFKSRQLQYSFTPSVFIPLAKNLTFSLGPTVKYGSSQHKQDLALINLERPYGYGDFGEVGGTGTLELDTRVEASKAPGGVAFRSLGYPRGGAEVRVTGEVWPKAWDVSQTFGSVEGKAAAYLTPGGDKAPTLALRAGGKKVFGTYPYFEAAYLGGGLGGFGPSAGDEPVRGLQRHRYAGDAAVYGQADLRIYVSQFNVFLPGSWGVLGFGDVGRVYYNPENSTKWHAGYGGGLWFAWLDRANTLSFSYGRSEGHNGFYARAGFAF
jgi:hypothetical protein